MGVPSMGYPGPKSVGGNPILKALNSVQASHENNILVELGITAQKESVDYISGLLKDKKSSLSGGVTGMEAAMNDAAKRAENMYPEQGLSRAFRREMGQRTRQTWMSHRAKLVTQIIPEQLARSEAVFMQGESNLIARIYEDPGLAEDVLIEHDTMLGDFAASNGLMEGEVLKQGKAFKKQLLSAWLKASNEKQPGAINEALLNPDSVMGRLMQEELSDTRYEREVSDLHERMDELANTNASKLNTYMEEQNRLSIYNRKDFGELLGDIQAGFDSINKYIEEDESLIANWPGVPTDWEEWGLDKKRDWIQFQELSRIYNYMESEDYREDYDARERISLTVQELLRGNDNYTSFPGGTQLSDKIEADSDILLAQKETNTNRKATLNRVFGGERVERGETWTDAKGNEVTRRDPTEQQFNDKFDTLEEGTQIVNFFRGWVRTYGTRSLPANAITYIRQISEENPRQAHALLHGIVGQHGMTGSLNDKQRADLAALVRPDITPGQKITADQIPRAFILMNVPGDHSLVDDMGEANFDIEFMAAFNGVEGTEQVSATAHGVEGYKGGTRWNVMLGHTLGGAERQGVDIIWAAEIAVLQATGNYPNLDDLETAADEKVVGWFNRLHYRYRGAGPVGSGTQFLRNSNTGGYGGSDTSLGVLFDSPGADNSSFTGGWGQLGHGNRVDKSRRLKINRYDRDGRLYSIISEEAYEDALAAVDRAASSSTRHNQIWMPGYATIAAGDPESLLIPIFSGNTNQISGIQLYHIPTGDSHVYWSDGRSAGLAPPSTEDRKISRYLRYTYFQEATGGHPVVATVGGEQIDLGLTEYDVKRDDEGTLLVLAGGEWEPVEISLDRGAATQEESWRGYTDNKMREIERELRAKDLVPGGGFAGMMGGESGDEEVAMAEFANLLGVYEASWDGEDPIVSPVEPTLVPFRYDDSYAGETFADEFGHEGMKMLWEYSYIRVFSSLGFGGNPAKYYDDDGEISDYGHEAIQDEMMNIGVRLGWHPGQIASKKMGAISGASEHDYSGGPIGWPHREQKKREGRAPLTPDPMRQRLQGGSPFQKYSD